MQFNHLKRRDFIRFVAGAVAWPCAARGQPPNKPVIGFLASPLCPGVGTVRLRIPQGLQETGYLEGKNVAIEYRWGKR
jgi:putative ABC transport system substrate-binding protein